MSVKCECPDDESSYVQNRLKRNRLTEVIIYLKEKQQQTISEIATNIILFLTAEEKMGHGLDKPSDYHFVFNEAVIIIKWRCRNQSSSESYRREIQLLQNDISRHFCDGGANEDTSLSIFSCQPRYFFCMSQNRLSLKYIHLERKVGYELILETACTVQPQIWVELGTRHSLHVRL